jgi:hypothetical protein
MEGVSGQEIRSETVGKSGQELQTEPNQTTSWQGRAGSYSETGFPSVACLGVRDGSKLKDRFFKFQISNFKFQISNFKFQISNYKRVVFSTKTSSISKDESEFLEPLCVCPTASSDPK